MVDVVADGAFGVADAVVVTERFGHAESVGGRGGSFTPKIPFARCRFAAMLPA